MGDPKKSKKKFSRPSQPWESERIREELILVGSYGLRNKKEVWRAQTKLRNYRRRARNIRVIPEERQVEETEILIKKLNKLGILPKSASIDDVLQLSTSDILERRLQTLVYRKGLAKTPYQSRQFIVHGHIAISGRRVKSPGYMVTAEEEKEIMYSPTSPLAKNAEHPERQEGVVS
ncbi:MAG: 30S ribosomal protein S4 [Candidatus Lokiarchaeota archaeon]|nr:30S ribosomal protein S4 [Candidatus Lokiarchaeota archaeon]